MYVHNLASGPSEKRILTEHALGSICATLMLTFSVIRAPYLHPPTFQRRSAPGEWYYFQQNPYHRKHLSVGTTSKLISLQKLGFSFTCTLFYHVAF